jgi:hypothetical protein
VTTAVDADHNPVQAAFAALGEHCATCSTCMTVNADGSNANLPCETADQLDQAYKDARRARRT